MFNRPPNLGGVLGSGAQKPRILRRVLGRLAVDLKALREAKEPETSYFTSCFGRAGPICPMWPDVAQYDPIQGVTEPQGAQSEDFPALTPDRGK